MNREGHTNLYNRKIALTEILAPKDKPEQANFVGGFKRLKLLHIRWAMKHLTTVDEFRVFLLTLCCGYELDTLYSILGKHNTSRIDRARAKMESAPKGNLWVKIPSHSTLQVVKHGSRAAIIALIACAHCAKSRPVFRANLSWYARIVGSNQSTLRRGMSELIDMQVLQKLYTPIVTVRAHGAKYMWGDLDIDDRTRLLAIEREAAKKFKYSKFIPPAKTIPTPQIKDPNTSGQNSQPLTLSEGASDLEASNLLTSVIH